MAFYKETPFEQKDLDYETCKKIYRNSTIGRRVVEALPNFALSSGRELILQEAPPEVLKRFEAVAKDMKQEDIIRHTLHLSRVFGVSSIFVAMRKKEDYKEDYDTKPNYKDQDLYDFKFIVLDPLNMSGSRIEMNPLSFDFLEFVEYRLNGMTTNRKRMFICKNTSLMYLDNTGVTIPFAPPSIFNNIYELLISYDRALEDVDSLLYKAGAIIYKYKSGGKFTGTKLDSISASKSILEQKKMGSVIAIENESDIINFPISSLSGLIETVNKLENSITVGINDTPASILFDRSLSNGFSDGDKDKQTEIATVMGYQEKQIRPLYRQTDYYIMLKAWDNSFIDEIKQMYPNEYGHRENSEIFREWAENFDFQFGNLYPEPESAVQDNIARKLDNLKRLMELGANIADIQEELNEMEIFKNNITLEESNVMRGEGGMGINPTDYDTDVIPHLTNTDEMVRIEPNLKKKVLIK